MGKTIAALVVIGVILTACTPAEEQVSSTSSGEVTSTILATATSTTEGLTTTLPPSTTTTTLLEGNWAEVALVMSGWALGWWDGDSWVRVEESTELPIMGGEDYQVALLGDEGTIIAGGQQTDNCPSSHVPGVALDEQDSLKRYIENDPAGYGVISGVGVSAPWNLTPRPVIETAGSAELEITAIELLEDSGFETERAVIFQVVEADLEGDGSTETLVVAEDIKLIFDASSGVYSLVFAVSPSWDEPKVLAANIINEDETAMASVNRIAAVADLSADGRMEVVLSQGSYESGGVTVHELTDNGFERRLGAGCGV